MQQLLRGLHRAEDLLLGLLLAALLALGLAQIGLRLFFGTGIEWAEPVERMGVLWLALLGALGATRERRHIAIDALPRLLPPKLQRAAWALAQSGTAVICGVLAYTGWGMVELEREAPTLFVQGIASWVPMLVFPAGFALMSLRFAVAACAAPPEPGHVDVHLPGDGEGQGSAR
jgi:TRAP-type C4-dicarboxylate transport system permease small subunit